jgi:hypothetical protein
VVGVERRHRFFERVAIADHHPFEQHRVPAQPPGRGRGAPLAPLRRTEIEVETFDHGGQVRGEIAATLEFSEDSIIAVDEPQANNTGKLVGVGDRQVVAPCDVAHHPIDQVEVFEKDLFVLHAGRG